MSNQNHHTNDNSQPEFMTVPEVAGLLRVHPRLIYRLADSGALPAARVGHKWRFSRRKVVAWLEAGGTASNAEEEAQ